MSSGPVSPLTSGTVISSQGGKISEQMGRWSNSVCQFLNSLLGTTAMGNGSTVAMQTRSIGTGGGPTNPQQPVSYRQITINGVTYWIALFQ